MGCGVVVIGVEYDLLVMWFVGKDVGYDLWQQQWVEVLIDF